MKKWITSSSEQMYKWWKSIIHINRKSNLEDYSESRTGRCKPAMVCNNSWIVCEKTIGSCTDNHYASKKLSFRTG
jgi:hypothetical protein